MSMSLWIRKLFTYDSFFIREFLFRRQIFMDFWVD